MAWLSRAIAGLAALVRPRRAEQELDEELRAYLDASVDEKVGRGLPRAAAERAARVEMGSVDAVKDHTRDAGWEAAWDAAWRDFRYAVRTLRKSPAFSAVAVVTLVLGIGANTTIFSAINAVMLRPLPVDRPAELVALATAYPDFEEPVFSYAAYRRLALEGASVADAIAASSARRDAITIDGPPEPIDLKWVSGNYFTTLRVAAAIGRTLLPSDDRPPAGKAVAVLSDAYWTRRFGRHPSVVGRIVRVRGSAFTVVGVAPPGFFGETRGEAPEIWIPMTAQPAAPSYLWRGHSTTWLGIVARLRPGTTLAQARAVLEAVYDRIRSDVAADTSSPEFRTSVLRSRLVVSEAPGGSARLRRPLTAPLLVLMGIVALVLIIACANLANLMLARAAARARETAVCLALGAARARVLRHGLAESVVLALVGGAGGLMLARWGSAVLIARVSRALPIAIDARPDLRVLAFATLLSGATAVVFGLVPALRAARIDPLPVLKGTAGSAPRAGRIPLRRIFVVSQMAVSLVLLVAAGVFLRSLMNLQQVDTGFDPDRVLLLRVTPPAAAEAIPPSQVRDVYRRLLARAEAVPGVEAASASFSGLFSPETWRNAIAVDGFEPPPGVTPRTFANAVTPRYFDVMKIGVLQGRAFTNADHETAPSVAVVNQTFVRQFFGGVNPLGRRVGLCSSDPCEIAPAPMLEIVGVAADARYVDLRESRRPMLYVPFTQSTHGLRQIEVRTAGDPAAVAATLHRELAAVDSRVSVVAMTSLRERVDASVAPERLIAQLSSAFGVLALLLAGIGLYGLVVYVTTHRTGEIAIRMALGADRRNVRRLVMRDTVALLAAGVAIGSLMALVVGRVVAQQLHGVSPNDPTALLLAIATLSAAALLAAYLPARRAARIDPLAALRSE